MASLNENCVRLETAIECCQGRVDPDLLERAETVIGRVDQRLALSDKATVIALIGATGTGKSSLFNALTRTALAEPGIRRPMTEHSLAATFGQADTSDLLDWLEISQRYVIQGRDLDGIVLLDMVDNDSVSVSHQQEADRLLEVVDQVFWVVDPQKYADGVLHERYLRPLASHAQIMIFVLNQIDQLAGLEADQIHEDFLRRLHEDGIMNPVVYETSALTGQGVDALRRYMIRLAAAKNAMMVRLEADVLVQAHALRAMTGRKPAGTLEKNHAVAVSAACMEVAGVSQIGEAVQADVIRQGRKATGWPWVAWINRFKPDPLKRLHLDQFRSSKPEEELTLTRSSIVVHPAARARIDMAVRAVGDEAASRLPRGWRGAVDKIARDQAATLPDAIDQAVVSTDLGITPTLRWWNVIRVLQWLIFAVTVVGLGWLAVNFVMAGLLGLPEMPTPRVGIVPLPTLMLLTGIVAGLLMGMLSSFAVKTAATAAGAKAVAHLRRAMETVAVEQIIAPINAELNRHDRAQEALNQIIGSKPK